MVSSTDQPAGPMSVVPDITAWLEAHQDIAVMIDRYSIPGGSVVGLRDPAGNVFHVFDQIDG